MLRTRLRLHAVTLVTALLVLAAGLVAVASPASAGWSVLCTGYASCVRDGFSHAGYATARRTMWWRMYAGHNCTNYVAYRMVRSGMPNERPWSGSGNATHWGVARSDLLDAVPRVGSVAWWRAGTRSGGRVGHVAYVEQVVSSTEVVVSQDSSGGSFSWARIRRSEGGWPTGFLHFNDVPLGSTARPVLSGTAEVGRVLTASPGRWSVEPTSVRYQWRADGRVVPGATGPRLTIGPGMVGRRLTVVVTAVRQGYPRGRASSTATPAVAAGSVTMTRQPAVVGAPAPGELLRLRAGRFRPADAELSVSWWRGDTRTGTGPSHRVGVADLGSRLEARTRVTRRGYEPLTHRVLTASRVRDGARLRVRATAERRRVRVVVTVVAAHVSPVAGRVVLRWQGRPPRTVTLRDGRAETTLPAPAARPRRLSARYTGTQTVAPAVLSRVVRVR